MASHASGPSPLGASSLTCGAAALTATKSQGRAARSFMRFSRPLASLTLAAPLHAPIAVWPRPPLCQPPRPAPGAALVAAASSAPRRSCSLPPTSAARSLPPAARALSFARASGRGRLSPSSSRAPGSLSARK
eukprot:5914191-Alexandrium_andersonii.AAC.2